MEPSDGRGRGFASGCGAALVAGGALFALTNAVLSPMMPTDQSEAVLRTSLAYLLRMSAANVVALLLLLGAVGLHLAQRRAAGAFGAAAFGVAFVGTSLVAGVEWANLFVLRPLAQTSPEALEPLDGAPLLNVGYAAAAGLFALGWLLLAVSAWRAGAAPRWAALTTIVGLVLIPALGASPLGLAGAVAGNVVFGLGLAGMGFAVVRGSRGATGHDASPP